MSRPQSGTYTAGGAHAWGARDTENRQQCVVCEWWRQTPRLDRVYYSRTKALTGTWSMIRPACVSARVAAVRA